MYYIITFVNCEKRFCSYTMPTFESATASFKFGEKMNTLFRWGETDQRLYKLYDTILIEMEFSQREFGWIET